MNGKGGLLSSCMVSYFFIARETRCEMAIAIKMVETASLKAGSTDASDGHDAGLIMLRKV